MGLASLLRSRRTTYVPNSPLSKRGACNRAPQKASAGRAITVAAPALIWWLSDVVCGSTRAM